MERLPIVVHRERNTIIVLCASEDYAAKLEQALKPLLERNSCPHSHDPEQLDLPCPS